MGDDFDSAEHSPMMRRAAPPESATAPERQKGKWMSEHGSGGSTSRAEVYAAIDGERAYQVERWKDSCCKGTAHTVTEWLVYMRDYAEEALHILSREPEPQASEKALHSVRKIAALGVACMEKLGAPTR